MRELLLTDPSSPDAWIDLGGRGSGQPELLCPRQQMLDRGGMPACSAARGALAHGLELGGDLLQRPVRRRRGDARDQPHQAVIGRLVWRAVHQAGLDDALGHQQPHGAAQPLGGPAAVRGAIEHAHHVAPGLARAHPAHGRQPAVEPGQDDLEMGGVASGAQLADGGGVAGAQAGIAADAAATARRP